MNIKKFYAERYGIINNKIGSIETYVGDDSEFRQVDAINPVNPLTGWRDNMLVQLFDPSTPADVANVLLQYCTKLQSSYAPNVLTDEELLAMLPQRVGMTSRPELDTYRQDLANLCNYLNVPAPTKEVEAPSAEVAAAPAVSAE